MQFQRLVSASWLCGMPQLSDMHSPMQHSMRQALSCCDCAHNHSTHGLSQQQMQLNSPTSPSPPPHRRLSCADCLNHLQAGQGSSSDEDPDSDNERPSASEDESDQADQQAAAASSPDSQASAAAGGRTRQSEAQQPPESAQSADSGPAPDTPQSRDQPGEPGAAAAGGQGQAGEKREEPLYWRGEHPMQKIVHGSFGGEHPQMGDGSIAALEVRGAFVSC